jgi:DtxR family Mn-dependent transcriptional regulator
METITSTAVENFIKTIYLFERRDGWDTRSGSIARELGITNAAATDMARKLATKNLIDYEKYKELKLTESGKRLATDIIRKHRLWETFLHQVLGLGLHEIHREAEMLEHATSDFLLEKISAYLGNPTFDPHGDPIPNQKGELANAEETISLSLADSGREYEICRLTGSDQEFYDFCQSNNLHIKSVVTVKQHFMQGKMTEIATGSAKLLLNNELSRSIYVRSLFSDHNTVSV